MATGSQKKSVGIQGAIYQERVNSFAENWPYLDPTTHACTPEALATAGFIWYAGKTLDDEPFGKCFACDVEIIVHDFGPITNPWDIHSERNPSCPYLKFRFTANKDIKFRDIYDIVVAKQKRATKIVNIEKALLNSAIFKKGELSIR